MYVPVRGDCIGVKELTFGTRLGFRESEPKFVQGLDPVVIRPCVIVARVSIFGYSVPLIVSPRERCAPVERCASRSATEMWRQ